MDFKNIVRSTLFNKYYLLCIFVIIVCAFSISMHNTLECKNDFIKKCDSMKDKCINGFSIVNLINIIMLSISALIVAGITFTAISSEL